MNRIPHFILFLVTALFSSCFVGAYAQAYEAEGFFQSVPEYRPGTVTEGLKAISNAESDKSDLQVTRDQAFVRRMASYIQSRNDNLSSKDAHSYAVYIKQAADEHNLDSLLLVALIQIESNFDASVVSGHGAKGLTQIVPKYHSEKIAVISALHNVKPSLLQPKLNILVGAQILKDCIDGTKSITAALLMYNGSVKDKTHSYAKLVLREYQKLKSVLS